MNFRFVLTHIIEFARAQGYSIAVVGGFGLHAYGFSRVTYDLDFVTEVALQASLLSFMESLGYETLYRSEGYSNHLHPQTEMGRVDFVYVRGESSRKIFARAKEKIFIDDMEAPVPRPEHLIASRIGEALRWARMMPLTGSISTAISRRRNVMSKRYAPADTYLASTWKPTSRFSRRWDLCHRRS